MAKATTPEASTDEPDPLHSVAEAMREAINHASDDTTKAREQISHAGPAVTYSLSRFAYTSSYMMSYGIVYATVFVAKAIPQDNPVVEGFIDGGRAAMEALNEAKGAPVMPSSQG